MKKIFLILTIVSSFLYSCEKDEKDPGVTMIKAEAISASSGKAVAKVDQTGDFKIIDHGFVYSLSIAIPDPQSFAIDQSNKVSLGSVIKSDTFSAVIPVSSYNEYTNGSNYKWNVWAYITNEKGTVYSQQSASFIPKQLFIGSVFPNIGKTGDTLTISGNNFDTSVGSIKVAFSYNYSNIEARVISTSESEIKIIVPSLTPTSSYYNDDRYSIKVTMGNNEKTLQNSFSILPTLTGFSPKQGTFNTYVTISGSQLDNISSVLFGDESASIYDRSSNFIKCYVPNTVNQRRSKIYIVKGGTQIEVPGGEFEMHPLTVTSISPLQVNPGSSITIEGTNFNMSNNSLWIGQTQISSYSESSSSLKFNMPNDIAPGEYKVKLSNGIDTLEVSSLLKVVVPTITEILPSSAYPGAPITINGHNFTSNNYVYFNGSGYYADTHDSTSYKLNVPYLTPGKYTVSVFSGDSYSQVSTQFTVQAPTLTSLTPTSGNMGTSVIIIGEGFGTNTYDVSVVFGNVSATVLSVSDTQINIKVPSNTGNGVWMVSVSVRGYTISNTLQFTIP